MTEEGGRLLWGISNSSAGTLCSASGSHFLWGRAFKATSEPKWTEIWIYHHHPILSACLVPEAPQWLHYLGGLPAWQSRDKERKYDVGWEANSQSCTLHFLCAIKNHVTLWIYTCLLYTTCIVNLSLFISNYTSRHQESWIYKLSFFLSDQNIQCSNVRYHQQ